MNECLSDQEINEFAWSFQDFPDSEEQRLHLEGCEACRMKVARLRLFLEFAVDEIEEEERERTSLDDGARRSIERKPSRRILFACLGIAALVLTMVVSWQLFIPSERAPKIAFSLSEMKQLDGTPQPKIYNVDLTVSTNATAVALQSDSGGRWELIDRSPKSIVADKKTQFVFVPQNFEAKVVIVIVAGDSGRIGDVVADFLPDELEPDWNAWSQRLQLEIGADWVELRHGTIPEK